MMALWPDVCENCFINKLYTCLYKVCVSCSEHKSKPMLCFSGWDGAEVWVQPAELLDDPVPEAAGR